MNKQPSNQEINASVSEYYQQAAGDSASVNTNAYELALILGYSAADLADLPTEANAALGCGNPLSKAHIQPGEVIVDLGCGKGMDVFIAAKQTGETGRVMGIDMVNEMIKKAQAISDKYGFTNTEFQVAEIEKLPLADQSAEVVISNGVISLVIDKLQVFREIYRILKPGGRISIADITLANPLPGSVLADPNQYDI